MYVHIPDTNVSGYWTIILIILWNSSLHDSQKFPCKIINSLTHINKGLLWNKKFSWLQVIKASTIWITEENEVFLYLSLFICYVLYLFVLHLSVTVKLQCLCTPMLYISYSSFRTILCLTLCLILTKFDKLTITILYACWFNYINESFFLWYSIYILCFKKTEKKWSQIVLWFF